jgi:ABC-type sugar transport system ATPase subunit
LRAEGITVPGKIDNLSVAVSAGEIVGLGGLVGSGRTTVLRALSGLEQETGGRLWIDGVERRWPTSPSHALDLGIALIPEDRKQGLVLGMSAQENIVLADLGAAASAGFLSERRLRDCASNAVRGYAFDRRRLSAVAGSLSGGNQQKLLLARWRHRPPRILLADEPTRGIDVGAKEEILSKLRDLADSGLAILFVSSELEEVIAVSDRILVLSAGRDAGCLNAEASVADILAAAFSLKAAHV